MNYFLNLMNQKKALLTFYRLEIDQNTGLVKIDIDALNKYGVATESRNFRARTRRR